MIDPAQNVESWEFDKLVTILLRQFKRLLAEHEVILNDADMRRIGEQVAEREPDKEELTTIAQTLDTIVQESVDVLSQWNLTFEQSLYTDMNDMPGWETTAEFLDIANEKINAETRITAGTSLMVALNAPKHAAYLIQAIEYDLKINRSLDVDAAIAKRCLVFSANVDSNAEDWLSSVKNWVNSTT